MRLKRRKTLTLLILLTGASLYLPAKVAFACTCAPPPSDEDALGTSDAVFSGSVVDIDDPEGDAELVSSARTVTYTFEVDAVAKGDVGSNQQVGTAASGASCGFGFRDGRRYVVFAEQDKRGDLSTSLCSNTHPLKVGENIDFASVEAPPGADGSAEYPRRAEEGGVPVIAVIGAALVLALAGAAWAMTRRRTA